MIGESAAVLRVEIRNELRCVTAGERLGDVHPDDILDLRIRLRRSGDHELTMRVPARSVIADLLIAPNVLHVPLDDPSVPFHEWDIRARTASEGSERDLVVTAKPILHRLATADLVSKTLANGLVLYEVTFADVTPADILDELETWLQANGFPYLSIGTVDPTMVLPSFSWKDAPPLAIIRALEEQTQCIAFLRENGTTGYFLDLLETPNTTDDPLDIVIGAQLLTVQDTQDILESANKIYGVGDARPDGATGSLANAAWLVDAVSGDDVDLLDPLGGDGPVQVDGQLDGLFLALITRPQITTPVSAVDLTNWQTIGVRWTVADASQVAVGDRIRIPGVSPYVWEIFNGVVLSVDVGNDYVFAQETSVAQHGNNGQSQMAALFVPSTMTRFQTLSSSEITDSIRVSASLSRVTVVSASGIAVDDLLEVRENASGSPLRALTNPDAIALYGGPTARPRVAQIAVPGHQGYRNYLRNGLFTDWPNPSAMPTGFTRGAATAFTISQNTDPVSLLPGSAANIRYAMATPTNSAFDVLVSDVIWVDTPPGDSWFTGVVWLWFDAFDQAAQVMLQLTPDGGFGLNLASAEVIPAGSIFGGTVVSTGSWVRCLLPPFDCTANAGQGLRLVVNFTAGYPVTNLVGNIDCVVGGIEFVRGFSAPQQPQEFDGNVIWHEVQRSLSERAAPFRDFSAKVRDLYRRDRTTYPWSQFKIGRHGKLFAPSIALAGAEAEITEVAINGLIAEETDVQFSRTVRSLAASGSASASGGIGGSSNPNQTTPPPSGGGSSTPANATWAKAYIASGPGETIIVDDLPSTATELSTETEFWADLSPFSFAWMDQVVIAAGPAGAKLAWQYFRASDSTWRFLDGTSGPTVAIDATGAQATTSAVAIETDARTRVLCRIVALGGDGASSARLGNGHVNAGTSQVTPVTPIPPLTTGASLPTTLYAHYDADLGVSLSGSNLTVWADQSGNARDLAPLVTGPTFDPTAVNGLPALEFVSTTTNDNTFGPVDPTFLTALSGDNTLFAVARVISPYNGCVIGTDHWGIGVVIGTGSAPFVNLGLGNVSLVFHDYSEELEWRAGTDFDIVVLRRSGNSWNIWLNGVKAALTHTQNLTQTAANLYLGDCGPSGWDFKGEIAEAGVYNRALSDAEVTALTAFLGAKFNIPVV